MILVAEEDLLVCGAGASTLDRLDVVIGSDHASQSHHC